jgi:DNA-binding MarR family transcriptional regulator
LKDRFLNVTNYQLIINNPSKTAILILHMDWKLLSFVLSSVKREKVIKCLANPNTPTKIAKETGISTAHSTRMLKRLVELGIVECKTPNKRKGKIYVLTAKGKYILTHLDK